jgi:hypothetical protein
VTLAALVLALVGQITGQSLLSQLFTGPLSGGPDQPPGQTNESSTPEQLSPRDADRLTPRQRETSGPSEVTDTAAREPSITPKEISLPPKETSATARPSPSSPSNQGASALSPEAATSKATPPQLKGSHRAELVRRPVSRGWGASYAVRLLDPAGKPVVVADVLLVARMADGTVENVTMGALPEPGTYRGTVPTDRSTPVTLRVRMSTGDKFVEVPVRP